MLHAFSAESIFRQAHSVSEYFIQLMHEECNLVLYKCLVT